VYRVGLDLGQRRSSLCVLDSNGKTIRQEEVFGHWPKLIDRIAQLPKPFDLCFEASCGYGYLYDKLAPLARRVVVAHPGQLRLIFRSKRKNNRIDAARIAKLLYLDAVPPVHVPSVNVREWRTLIEFRQRLLSRRVALKNQIRALLRAQGIAANRSLWSKKGMAWLNGLELSSMDMLRRDIILGELQQIDGQIRRVEKELKQIADRHPGMTLLMSIPGVGIRTAEAFAAYIDDPRRFARIHQVASYLGLVPCQDATGDANRLGHITKDGPATVRKLLCEAAWQAVRYDPGMRSYFERLMHNDPDRKKIAIVAVAHRLARIMLAMLRSGETYRKEEKRVQVRKGTGRKGWRRTGPAGPPVPGAAPPGGPAALGGRTRIQRKA
jgi:transposase